MTATVSSADYHRIDEWLDTHRDFIKYASKGYLTRARDAIQDELHITISQNQFRTYLRVYRIKNDCPITLKPNKYYKPSPNTKWLHDQIVDD